MHAVDASRSPSFATYRHAFGPVGRQPTGIKTDQSTNSLLVSLPLTQKEPQQSVAISCSFRKAFRFRRNGCTALPSAHGREPTDKNSKCTILLSRTESCRDGQSAPDRAELTLGPTVTVMDCSRTCRTSCDVVCVILAQCFSASLLLVPYGRWYL